MVTDFTGKTAILVAIALAPAVLRWWWGQRLIARPNDPALPERMHAMARRSNAASATALVALIALSPRGTAWTLPLLLAGRLVAAYPSRRVLFEERWSLAGYLSFYLRLFVAVYGLWLTIAVLPLLVPLGGSLDWLVGALIAAILLAWNARTSDVVRSLLRARPIENPGLRGRFTALAYTAGLARMRFERIDLRGGALANAAALPSLRTPVVIFTDPLLAQLDDAEVAAICAHELAHHEYYTPRRLRRMRLVNAGLIVTGVAIPPLARVLDISWAHWVILLWYLSFLAEAVWRARDRQRNETASDLRAVALCGDADALIRALTRLYLLGRVPRRLDPQFERQATHPSLARRIRDIRRVAGLSTSTLAEDSRFVAPDHATEVTFQPDRLNWSEGEAASHILNYAHLSEVRVSTPHSGPPSLIVVERGGRRWTMTLDSEDVGRAQAVLDVVDGRLAEPVPAPRVRPVLTRVFAAFAALLALPLGHVAAGALAIVVALRPSSPLLAAAGFGTVAAAAVTIRDNGALGPYALLALVLALVGATLLVTARATRNDPAPRRAWWPLSVLAAGAALSIGAIALSGLDAVTLHQSARTMSAPLVWSIAVAGALVWTRNRFALAGAVLAAIAAAALALASSMWFLDRFGRDPLLVRGEWMTAATLNLRPSTELDLPFYGSHVRLSPGSRAIAVSEDEDSGGENGHTGPTFHVGRPEAALVPLQADDLRFVDDQRVLLLTSARDGVDLREVAIAPPNHILWAVHLPLLTAPRLSLNTDDLSWRVLGSNRAREVVRFEGQVGDVAFRETRWPLGPESDGYIAALAASEDRAIAVESHYERSLLQRTMPAVLSQLTWTMPRTLATLRAVGPGGHQALRASRFGAQCITEPVHGRSIVCSVFDGTDTRLLTLNARGDVTPVGTMPGTFVGRDVAGRDWILGWGQTPVAIHLSTREAFRISSARGQWITDVSADGAHFATIGYRAEGSVVRVYSRDDD